MSQIRERFFSFADKVQAALGPNEQFLAHLQAERSDFVRFNHGLIRQAGGVEQAEITLSLVDNGRQASIQTTLGERPRGSESVDNHLVKTLLQALREKVVVVPPDPFLLLCQETEAIDDVRTRAIPSGAELADAVILASGGADLVGILAVGPIEEGFASSFGRRCWFSDTTFHLDWSLFDTEGHATKSTLAGSMFDAPQLSSSMEEAERTLKVLARPVHSLKPGEVRAFLTPAALGEIFALLGWDAFGLKAQRSKQSALLRLSEGETQLHPQVTLSEHAGAGVGPTFSSAGFTRPGDVMLVKEGAYAGALVGPRSGKEYSEAPNGASDDEVPVALDMRAGTLEEADVFSQLGTGLHVSNLWYLNYSDRQACRMTGMTRFATLWVKNGEPVAPLDVMRFDDSFYALLGRNLEALTAQRDFLLDGDTYSRRSTSSMHLPGALVSSMMLTL